MGTALVKISNPPNVSERNSFAWPLQWTFSEFLSRAYKSKGRFCSSGIFCVNLLPRRTSCEIPLENKAFCSAYLHRLRDLICIIFRYHHFKVKVPSGTPIIVRKETFNEYDPFALACLIPAEVELIPEPLRKVAIYSKSQRKSYTLVDVLGSQIGRIQYFLNRELSYLLECGKISRIGG